jgi:ribosomal protein S27AE
MTEAQADQIVALLTEIRDLLQCSEEPCDHPPSDRVMLAPRGRAWRCGICGYVYEA